LNASTPYLQLADLGAAQHRISGTLGKPKRMAASDGPVLFGLPSAARRSEAGNLARSAAAAIHQRDMAVPAMMQGTVSV
jgi:hypothetical protein